VGGPYARQKPAFVVDHHTGEGSFLWRAVREKLLPKMPISRYTC
jgi:hypothetical protein